LSGKVRLFFRAVAVFVAAYTKVKGKPDFVFLDKKIAVFVDGCFWHGHNCRNLTPSDNKEYWDEKRKRNMQRDIEVTDLFEKRGWTIIRIWECELKKKNRDILDEKLTPILRRTDLHTS